MFWLKPRKTVLIKNPIWLWSALQTVSCLKQKFMPFGLGFSSQRFNVLLDEERTFSSFWMLYVFVMFISCFLDHTAGANDPKLMYSVQKQAFLSPLPPPSPLPWYNLHGCLGVTNQRSVYPHPLQATNASVWTSVLSFWHIFTFFPYLWKCRLAIFSKETKKKKLGQLCAK